MRVLARAHTHTQFLNTYKFWEEKSVYNGKKNLVTLPQQKKKNKKNKTACPLFTNIKIILQQSSMSTGPVCLKHQRSKLIWLVFVSLKKVIFNISNTPNIITGSKQIMELASLCF